MQSAFPTAPLVTRPSKHGENQKLCSRSESLRNTQRLRSPPPLFFNSFFFFVFFTLDPPSKNKIKLNSQTYVESHTSALWIITMQIVCPCCAFWVAYLAGREVYRLARLMGGSGVRSDVSTILSTRLREACFVRQKCYALPIVVQNGPYVEATRRRSNLSVSLAICIIEAVCCFLIGLILALGHYGPYVLPLPYYLPFVTLLSGPSFFTTVRRAIIRNIKNNFEGFSFSFLIQTSQ